MCIALGVAYVYVRVYVYTSVGARLLENRERGREIECIMYKPVFSLYPAVSKRLAGCRGNLLMLLYIGVYVCEDVRFFLDDTCFVVFFFRGVS